MSTTTITVTVATSNLEQACRYMSTAEIRRELDTPIEAREEDWEYPTIQVSDAFYLGILRAELERRGAQP